LWAECECSGGGAGGGEAVTGCTFMNGDGTGGTESIVGDASNAEACAAMVVATEPTANGATYSNTGGTACYAEFGQTGSSCEPNSPAACSPWQNCAFEADAGALCTFGPGDGSGGTEATVGVAESEAACAALVAREQPKANGATFPTATTDGTGACYAEFGMTGAAASDSWQTCMLPSVTPDMHMHAPPDLGEGCDWVAGDGSGGSEESVGDAPTALACTQLVQSTRPEANGATYSTDGTSCYAEFGMTGHVESTTWQTCELRAATVGCDFAEGDGTGDSEEAVGDAETPAMCAQRVASTRPGANGATYSMDGTACYAEFGMAGSTGAPSAWQTCMLVQGGGAAEDECADDFGSIFPRIQSTCCAQDSDCAHGSPNCEEPGCADLVLDFWGRCEGAVAATFDADLSDQLDAFATVCEQVIADAGNPDTPAPTEYPERCSADLPTVEQRCCKGRDCDSIRKFKKCSRSCAAIYVPLPPRDSDPEKLFLRPKTHSLWEFPMRNIPWAQIRFLRARIASTGAVLHRLRPGQLRGHPEDVHPLAALHRLARREWRRRWRALDRPMIVDSPGKE
jgi:hypothetical protein